MTWEDKPLPPVTVVKIGGATLGQHDTTLEDLVYLQKKGQAVVVVHGGGKVITGWLDRQGLASRFISGERVTDRPALEVVTAVLAGLVNKELVAAITSLGGRAIGISGADGGLLQGRVKDPELGYVGSVTRVDPAPLAAMLAAGYLPVVAPVGLLTPAGPREAVKLLNINADTAAGEIAAALGAARLIFLTDVAGIADGAGRTIPELSPRQAEALIGGGVASGGMVPKIRACLRALPKTPITRIIDGRQPHALRHEIEGAGGGTTIRQADE
ncbi:MAG: acetylglutamate kinase [Chloroflexota bacterium]